MVSPSRSMSSTIVVTLLSPSPAASRRMRQFLQTLAPSVPTATTTAPPTSNPSHVDTDDLNQVLVDTSLLVRTRPTLDSVTLSMGQAHSNTHSILHWLAVDPNNGGGGGDTASETNHGGMELLSLQAFATPPTVQDIRTQLARLIQAPSPPNPTDTTVPGLVARSLETWHTLVRTVTNRRIVRDYLPLSSHAHNWPLMDSMDLDHATPTSQAPDWHAGNLKEIVIPVYANHVSHTLFANLTRPGLSRWIPGVHRFHASAVGIRPIPMAPHDRSSLAPTLVFHTPNLDHVPADYGATKLYKIGYAGRGGPWGQLVVETEAVPAGMDVRLCAAPQSSSRFAEAQDSLLAGSLHELQSQFVLTRASASSLPDPRINGTDCWVEFRANVQRPQGFWSSLPRVAAVPHRIAKPPNLPFE